MNKIVSPTGFLDQNNYCSSLKENNDVNMNNRNVRSRESIDPNVDLSYYFNQYIAPKYGLSNINVSNVASFMKDLEMNWSKLDNSLKEKVLSILVDNIFVSGNYDFKNELLKKLNIQNNNTNNNQNNTNNNQNNTNNNQNNTNNNTPPITQANQSNNNPQMNEDIKNNTVSKETFGEETKKGINIVLIILIIILLLLVYYFFVIKKTKIGLPYKF
jgi:hypothetical protein